MSFVYFLEKNLFMLILENQPKSNNLDNNENENENKTSTWISFHTGRKHLVVTHLIVCPLKVSLSVYAMVRTELSWSSTIDENLFSEIL